MLSQIVNSANDEVNIYMTPTPSFEDGENNRPLHVPSPKRLERVLHGFSSSPVIDWGNFSPLPLMPFLDEDEPNLSLEPMSLRPRKELAFQLKMMRRTVEEGALYIEYMEHFGKAGSESKNPETPTIKQQSLASTSTMEMQRRLPATATLRSAKAA
jgi:hypothetical protein